ncbi:restriction endonuclease subunit S [Pseudomonas sp. JI-2]|nr:restriction endonuclease subunit S [Pseudomonas sp. JI-2]
MTALLTDNLPLLAGAPNGIKKLRELILELAVRGKLVPQDPNDEPASELLKRIAEEKARLMVEGKIRKQKPLAVIDADEKPFELPAGWQWSSLAQVAFVNPRNAAADSLEVSFVPMTFIGTRFDDQHAQEPRLWSDVKQGFTHFAEGDIGVAKITPCFENSKACVFSNLVNGLGAGTTELHVVRPVTGSLDPRYVLAYLKSPQFLRIGETKMTGTAGQKRLPKDFVEANPFPLPPLAEQHRIVAKVDELMALCDRLEAQQADAESAHALLVQALLHSLTQAADAEDFAASWQRLAEHFHTLFITEPSINALKQTLLQLAVMGKLVPQDPNDEPADELLEKIASEIAQLYSEGKIRKPKSIDVVSTEDAAFEAPQGWKWLRLSQITRQLGDGLHGTPIYSKDGEYYFVNGNNLKEGKIAIKPETKTVSEAEYIKHKKPLDGQSILVSINGTIGNVAFYNSEKIVLGKSACYLNLASGVSKDFVRLLIEGPGFMKYALKSATGTTIKNLGLKAMNDYPIALPPLAEQHRIVAKVDQLTAICDQLKTRLTQARRLNEQLATALVEQAVA